MKLFKSIKWGLVILIGMVTSSCQKQTTEVAKPGISEVTLSITNPIENGIYTTGETIHLDGIADADALLGGWRSTLVNTLTGENIESFEQRYEQSQYILHHHWEIDSPDTLQLKVIVDVLSVNDEVLTSKTVLFKHVP